MRVGPASIVDCDTPRPVGLPAPHHSGHLHAVGNKLPSTANRQFALLNAAQVWNAASATNRGNLKPHSFHSFARQISSRFSQVSFHLLRPGNLLTLRRLRYCYSGKVFPRTPFCSLNPNLPNRYKQKARVYFALWFFMFYKSFSSYIFTDSAIDRL